MRQNRGVAECCEGNNPPGATRRQAGGPPAPAVDGPALQDQALPGQAGEGRLHPGVGGAPVAARHPQALCAVLGLGVDGTEAAVCQQLFCAVVQNCGINLVLAHIRTPETQNVKGTGARLVLKADRTLPPGG